MTRPTRLGHRVRRERASRGLTQVQMAESLGISPSYLNLIEHDRRPLTISVLLKLAQVYSLDLQTLAADDDGRLLQELLEVFGDSLFDRSAVKRLDVEGLVDVAPEAGRAVVSLYRAYRASIEDRNVLAEQMAGEGVTPGLAEPPRLPSEEVSDFLQDNRNHFPDIEAAADQLRQEVGEGGKPLDQALVEHLKTRHDVEVVVVSADKGGSFVRRFEPETRRLTLSEVLPPRSRHFQLAHQIALLALRPTLEAHISRVASSSWRRGLKRRCRSAANARAASLKTALASVGRGPSTWTPERPAAGAARVSASGAVIGGGSCRWRASKGLLERCVKY